jgi:hypothetical protein
MSASPAGIPASRKANRAPVHRAGRANVRVHPRNELESSQGPDRRHRRERSERSEGSFDFGQLLTYDIDRIEVGPQSGLYGADAIGGVISITTKGGDGPPKAKALIECGSFGTLNETMGFSGSTPVFSYYMNLAHFDVANTPVTPPELLPPGRQAIGNAYENWTLSTKFGAHLSDSLDASLVARYIDSTLRFTGDDFSTFPATPAAAGLSWLAGRRPSPPSRVVPVAMSGSPLTVAGAAAELEPWFRIAFPVRSLVRDRRWRPLNGLHPPFVNADVLFGPAVRLYGLRSILRRRFSTCRRFFNSRLFHQNSRIS